MILLIILAVVSKETAALQEFECGSHGRFEYCIDGFLGCVVGCHCHPGFYFDTLSKICEPNSKLIIEARRMNSEKTEVATTPEVFFMTTAKTSITPAPNATPPKNPEDLGDWLYNQFFKTIEESVVRHVNHTDKEPTRRVAATKTIGTNTPLKKSNKKKKVRITTKSLRAGKSNVDKARMHKLKKHMQRITENDSIFKTEEVQSGSDTSSSDSSEGSSSESGSKAAEAKKKCDHKNDDFKKIVIIKKKPKSLPNFVFLPNMDTPFYPPLSLAMPPAVPMYPMVPVPPYCSETICEPENSSSTTPATTISSGNQYDRIQIGVPTLRTPPIVLTTEPNDHIPSASTGVTAQTTPDIARGLITDKNNTMDWNSKILNQKKDMMHQNLVRKIKRKKKMRTAAVSNMGQQIIPEVRVPKYSVESLRQSMSFKHKDPASRLKYLSELIHRGKDRAGVSPLKPVQTRRLGNPIIYPGPTIDYDYQDAVINEADPDNQFYNDLGRQIASVIQGFDDTDYQDSPIFYENTASGRIDPDRSGRSSRHLPAHAYTDSPSRDVKENLFDIENEVQHVADKLSPLDLVELENVIKEMRLKSVDVNKNKSNHATPKTPKQDLNPDIPLSMQTRRNNMQTINDSFVVFSKQVTKHTNYKLKLRPQDAEALKMHLSSGKDFNFNGQNQNTKLSPTSSLRSYDTLRSGQPIVSFYQSRHERLFPSNNKFMPQSLDKPSENFRNSLTSAITPRPATYGDLQKAAYRYPNNKPLEGNRAYVYSTDDFNYKPKSTRGPTYYNHELSMFDLFDDK